MSLCPSERGEESALFMYIGGRDSSLRSEGLIALINCDLLVAVHDEVFLDGWGGGVFEQYLFVSV